MSSLPHSTRSNETIFRLTSHALVALMMTCAAFTLLSLVDRLLPGWQPFYLAALCFFCALERLYTYRRFEKLHLFSKEWSITLATEWVVIALLVKLITGLSHGPGLFLTEIAKWQVNFNRYFLTGDFNFALVLMLITWLLSGAFASLLNEMDITRVLQLEIEPGQEKGKLPARERLMGLIFSTGTVLVLMTAVVRLDMRAFFAKFSSLRFEVVPALAGGGASTLLYFMFGLALLSQTRFFDLHTRWSIQRIPVSRRLGRGWALYSLGFLLLTAALVALLPTSYSLKTMTVLGAVIQLLANVLFFVSQAIIVLFLFLISLPLLLFGRQPERVLVQPALPTAIPNAVKLVPPVAPPAWLDATKMLIFWSIFAAILIFSLIQYLRQHREVMDALRKMSAHARLSRIWQWLRSQFKKAQTGIARTLQAGRERLRRAAAGSLAPGGFLSMRNLDARQKITFFYLALVRRGGEKGLPRRASQTPYEYASTLDAALPDAEDDIDALTNAFIEARYSPRPVQPEQVNLVKSTWERLRKTMRFVRR